MSARVAEVVLALGVLAVAASMSACGGSEDVATRAESGALCRDCHETSHGGGHDGLACGGCHAVDHALADQLAWSSTGLASLPDHSQITECGMCHEDRPRTAVATEGHRSHAHIEGRCGACHTTVHSGEPPTECGACHAGVEQHGSTADTPCNTCHAFRPEGVTALTPAAIAGLTRDAGHESIATRVHGAVDCRRCHDPHEMEEETVACESCHRGYLAEQVRSSSHDSCTGCHEPHGDREQPAVDCLRCHTYPRQGHGWGVASPELAAASRADTAARITHEGNCASCHDPHTSIASEDRCASCHEEQRAALDTLPPGSHERCTTCHQPHEPAPTAAVCTSCHADVHARDANVGEHRDCLSCHEPHHARPSPREACASCHASAHAQTAASASAHRDCTACHDEHGAPLAPTAQACARCHERPTRSLASAAAVPAEHRCAGCHAPHGFGGDDAARSRCASCHRETISSHASHRGACTDCHEAHEAPLGRGTECASCHAEVHPRVAAHLDCASCHTPHTAAVEALDRCVTCHADEAASAARWPRASPHAGECIACHTPHDEHATPTARGGSRERLCQSCHVEESARSHVGPHERCIDCHRPHATGTAPLAQTWWSSCARCHSAESTAVAAAEGTHARCVSCHATPGAPRPTCTSCHATNQLRLGHGPHLTQPTTTCASCHESHGTAPPGPDRCLSCHEAQRAAGHFADAPSCQSCHPFR